MGYFLEVLRARTYKWQPSFIKWKRALILITATFGIWGYGTIPQKVATPDYQVKAVFLYNIAQFIDWPQDSFPNEKSPIIIGVLGSDPFGSYLDETVQGEEINGHPVIIERYAKPSQVKNCQILFIHLTSTPKLSNVLNNLKGKRILTVGDATNFAKQGGMVWFFKQEKKIKIGINLDAVKKENIIISSKLLRLAEIVDPKY